ncbi:MAG TPA: hypothetical protein VMU87_06970 [Stellaceae bacterium]|nr:hypothetical protein [Stellaceae bacterium]
MPDVATTAKQREKLGQLINIEGFESEEALLAAAVAGLSAGRSFSFTGTYPPDPSRLDTCPVLE